MLKGRLLRQEAINLESDQNSDGTTAKANDKCHIGPLAESVTEQNIIPKHEITVRQRSKEQPHIASAFGGLNHDKSVKHTIFSKRIHSSPSNISKSETFRVTRRIQSADALGLGRKVHKDFNKRHSVDSTRGTRTLEEVTHEFLLNCHHKKIDLEAQEERWYSHPVEHVDKGLLHTESNRVEVKASHDVSQLSTALRTRIKTSEGEIICLLSQIKTY